MDDLKKITADYTGVLAERVTERDIYTILCEIIWEHLNLHTFTKFVQNVDFGNFYTACLRHMLIVANLDLCKPDPRVLPLSDDAVNNVEVYNWSE